MASTRRKNTKRGGKATPKSSKVTKNSRTPKTPKTPKDSRNPKTPKTPKSSKPRNTSEDVPRDVLGVNWAIPKAKRKDVPEQQYIIDYAHALYNREPNELQPVQAPLPEAQMRVPIYQKKGGKDMQAGDPNQSSTALRNLYNNIKDRSVNEPGGQYNITAIMEHFEYGNENTVVILSNAEDEEVLGLDDDRRLQVTVNGQTAHIDFIRHIPAREKDILLAWFIELPRGISVTVNGITYTNDGASSPTPFFIGPLQGYAVIELLSQPAFFFRHEGCLKYTVTTRKVSTDEVQRRDRNGDVSSDNVTVRWLTLEPEPEDASEVENARESDSIHVDVGNPQVEGHEPAVMHRPNGDGLMEEHCPEEIEYSDAFTDDGQPIMDPCAFVQNGLKMHTSTRIASIIPRVIASINHRQLENAGFSFVHNNAVLRPGRTLITALTDCGRYLLVVSQVQPDSSIRIRVLYPRTWRSYRNHREKILIDLRNWFMRTDWWRNSFDSHQQMVGHLPKDIEWVPCAQTPTQEGTFTYTILNAWALVMGLEPDPTFSPIFHGNEAFFIKAERIFDLALSDSLTWKVLLAFLRCTGFVKLAVTAEGENSEDADLPATNRRFDQRKRSFEALVADQTLADQAFARKNLDTEQMAVQLEEGLLHRATFASDSFTEEHRGTLVQIVAAGQWRLKDTVEQLQQRLAEFEDRSESSSSTDPSPEFSLIEDMQLDELAVPKDFKPCEHLDKAIEMENLFHRTAAKEAPQIAKKAFGSEDENPLKVPKLAKTEIQDSIAAVVRAFNRRHRPGAGFTTRSSTTEVKSSVDGNEDSIAIYVYEATEDHELCVMVQKPKEGTGSCMIIDSGFFTTENDTKSKIRKQLRKELSVIGPIPWISGPQQAAEHHSGYYVVLTAWSIVLGLPLDIEGFEPSPKLIRDAYCIIRAVLQDEVGWLDIWALLRCHGYVGTPEAPALGRRFGKTISSHEHDAYVIEMREKEQKAATKPKTNLYDHFQPAGLRRYGATCDWDESYPEDGITGFTELQPSEWTDSMISPGVKQQDQAQPTPNGVYAKDGIAGFSELQPSEFDESMVSVGHTQDAHLQPIEEFKPCEHLQNALSTLLADREIRKALRTFRKGVNTEIGEWLRDEETVLSVASVLMAINNMQGMEEGFSIVLPHAVTMCMTFENIGEGALGNIIRPGRPLITPITYSNHTVLLVAQFNEKYRPTISILDSLASHYSLKKREELFNYAWRLVCHTSWWRYFFPSVNHINKIKPQTATWVRAAYQPSSNECGYFAILNGWALALGLELNPDVELRWTDALFQQVKDVVHLARIGHADWKLIFAFLRCHDFVRDGVVHENRRFARTFNSANETEFQEALEEALKTENNYWKKPPTGEAMKRMRNSNRVPNMIGTQHNVRILPGQCGGSAASIERLKRFRRFKKNCSFQQMFTANQKLTRNRLEDCKKKVTSASSSKKPSREVFVEAILEEINQHYQGMDGTIQKSPADWADDTIDLYNEIIKDDEVQKILGNNRDAQAKPWTCMIEASELNLAIVSVLEAIDNLQSDLHTREYPKSVFAGGFSLTTSHHLQLALSGDISPVDRVISRPRRPWLIPIVVARDSLLPELQEWVQDFEVDWDFKCGINGHAFLVLVQEVTNQEFNSGESCYEIQYFDSEADIFGDVVVFFAERIEAAAARLGWSTHRTELGEPLFDEEVYTRDRILQQYKPYQSGYHVLINAWIIAMGLTFNPEVELDQKPEQMYREVYILSQAATSGILDWKTLVTWLFAHELTNESEFSAVSENRRFGHTFRQTDEDALADRITQQYKVVDDRLGELDLADAPYDYSNNFVYEEEDKDEEQNDPAGDAGLERRMDDADLEFVGLSRGTKRKSREDSDRGLHFLNRYQISSGDVKKIAESCSSAYKKRRVFGDLSFLEVC